MNKVNPRVRSSLSYAVEEAIRKAIQSWVEESTWKDRSLNGFVEERASDLLSEVERILEVEGGVELG